ncbi:hypothetical protein [Sediminibacterium goheungense]|uniref:Uncharacterized protein n=1 Tax=Sediminibacterium goheungense TaxID=1086393 RepID=A0A4R6IUT0_9BACT|nr:hypothetical protein [Sediminibacterium goheungense]TDO26379.1 hypothetical protein BC659_1685 [Sediminibacterium goheungense]
MKFILSCFTAILLLTSCSSDQKRVVVFSKGSVDINTDTKTIKATDGAGHEDKTVDFVGKTVELTLNTPSGDAKVTLTENGYYIVNVKNDTIIGSQVNYSDPQLSNQVITQEALRVKIDSLHNLVNNKNVGKATRNFYILPNSAVHLTDNFDAIVVGPFHQMRSAESKDGKAPEVYRFYSIKEIRETIAKLEGMTGGKKTEE